MTTIPALRRQRQEELNVIIVSYIASSGLNWTTQDPASKSQTYKKGKTRKMTRWAKYLLCKREALTLCPSTHVKSWWTMLGWVGGSADTGLWALTGQECSLSTCSKFTEDRLTHRAVLTALRQEASNLWLPQEHAQPHKPRPPLPNKHNSHD